MNKVISILFIIISWISGIAQITPGEIQNQNILLSGGILHMGDGEIIQNSAIGFEKGLISELMNLDQDKIDSSKYDVIINIDGQDVYPGFIAMNSTLGLMEIGAVRATKDYRETGNFNPNSRTLTAFNTDSRITPTVRSNGILLGQISPRGGLISGTSSVMRFDAWNWEDAVVKADEGIHMNWPTSRVNRTGASEAEIKKTKTKVRTLKDEIYNFFNSSQAYCEGTPLSIIDLKLEAMKGIFLGSKRLYIHANEVSQIKEIIEFKKEFKIQKLTLVGGRDAHYIVELLAENDISVIIKRVHSLPRYKQGELDISYRLPSILFKSKVLFCFDNQGDMEQMQSRNIPFLAGTAVAHGLPYEEAIKALTSNCAKILGIEKYGTIKKGMSATLFVSEGDALDIVSNKVTHAFIDGRIINLSNDQEKNYLKYRSKYGLEIENKE
jgi:imidazolonepropionase-like amidohydrolase